MDRVAWDSYPRLAQLREDRGFERVFRCEDGPVGFRSGGYPRQSCYLNRRKARNRLLSLGRGTGDEI